MSSQNGLPERAARLPDLLLGSSGGHRIPGETRSRGLLIDGQPGSGKTTLLIDLLRQDATSPAGVVALDPHDLAEQAIAALPPEAEDRVVILDLRDEAAPGWPLMVPSLGGDEEERLLAAEFLAAAWRADWGESAVGPRAEYLLRNALMLAPAFPTPLEAMASLADARYRQERLRKLGELIEQGKAGPSGFGLHLGWSLGTSARSEGELRSWSQAVENKLQPLLLHPWTRRAAYGFPPLRLRADGKPWRDCPVVSQDLVDEAVDAGRLGHVTWLGGGWVEVEAHVRGETVRAVADIGARLRRLAEREGQSPEHVEVAHDIARQHLRRQAVRAGWRLWSAELERRGAWVRELVDIAALMDEGKIVFISASTARGEAVASFVALTTLLKVLLRGLRMIDLPPELRLPAAVYVDEARLYISASVDRLLAELRKSNSALVMAVQSLEQLREWKVEIVNMVGALVFMMGGFQEDIVVANLTGRDLQEIRDLERGQGLVSVIDQAWKKATPATVRLAQPQPLRDSARVRRIRERSRLRYTLPVEEAERWAALRERMIADENAFAY